MPIFGRMALPMQQCGIRHSGLSREVFCFNNVVLCYVFLEIQEGQTSVFFGGLARAIFSSFNLPKLVLFLESSKMIRLPKHLR